MIPYTLITAIPILSVAIYNYKKYLNIYNNYNKYSRNYKQINALKYMMAEAMQGASQKEYFNTAKSTCPNEAPQLVKLVYDNIISGNEAFNYWHIEGLTKYDYIPLILFPLAIIDFYRFITKNESKQEIQNSENNSFIDKYKKFEFYISERYNSSLKSLGETGKRSYDAINLTLQQISKNIYNQKFEENYMKNLNLEAVKKSYCYGIGTAGNIAKISAYGFSFHASALLHNKILSALIPDAISTSALNILKAVPGSSYFLFTDNVIDLINKSTILFLPEIFCLKKGIPGAFGIAISSYYFVSNSENIYKNSVIISKNIETLVEDSLSLGLCESPKGLFDDLF